MHPTPARLYTLGPKGTFSDMAAQRLKAHLTGDGGGRAGSPAIVFTRAIPEVVAKAEADPDALGVFPIENSDTGTVIFALDALVRHKVSIEWEINVRVRFSLLANAPLEEVRTVYAQPVAREQCNLILERRMAEAKVILTHSNTESGRKFLASRKRGPRAAIVPTDYGAAHPEFLVETDVQNHPDNTTRFLVVRAASAAKAAGAPDFARGKTSLLIEPKEDYPGLLYQLLRVFNKYKLNLCRLESRPAKVRPWTYNFFLDVTNNGRTADCLRELDTPERKVTVLGCFDTLEAE